MTGVPLAELHGATVSSGDHTLLPPVDLTIDAGETVAIIGRSGTGKTTLLHVLAGLTAPTAGTATAGPAALMPQRDGLMPWATARDNAALPLRIAGRSRAAARAAADAQLAAVGLAEQAGRRVARLSGGQRQRVALARTLLTGRSLLLLDEPFAAVDALTRDELHELLLAHLSALPSAAPVRDDRAVAPGNAHDDAGTRGATSRAAVLVTHDIDEAVRLATRVLVLTAYGLVVPSAALIGSPGDRLAARGGEPLRAAIHAELSR